MNQIDSIKELVVQLNNYRNEYYNNSNSLVSDFEYDQLFDELKALEEETGMIMAASPTQTVGYEVKSNLTKVKHNHPMLSLDKTKSVDDVIKFLNSKDAVIMAKMDGLTCSLRYSNGELVSAETRGNGEIGEDIIHCAKAIKNIPLKIACQDEVIIDGEVIIDYDDFEKINLSLPEDQRYKHPRNLASGSIRQLDSKIAAQRHMKFIAWKCIKGCNDNSFVGRWGWMAREGFDTVPLIPLGKDVEKEKIEHSITLIQKWAENEKYPIDGCVFGYDDVVYGDSLGATGHHLRSQLAYKFYDGLYPTKLKYIDWTMGKTGQLTPTAVFDTIEIDGTDVSRASLHNISIIKKLNLTNHCTVNIYKANQIIPQIDSCEKDGDGDISIPPICPICGEPTEIVKDNDSEVLMCTNLNCSGKKLGQFVHFVSRKGMNIDGLSEATLEALLNANILSDFKSLYHLSNYKEQIIKMPGFGARSYQKLIDSIEKSRDITCEAYVTALGIPNIGSSAAKTIAKAFNGNYYHFIDALADKYDFTQLTDFGNVMNDSLYEWYNSHDGEQTHLWDNLNVEMHFVVPEVFSTNNNVLDGKTFCITGSLVKYANRDALVKDIEHYGGKFVSGVSKNTNYLINNDTTSNSGKNKKAMELNIPIISEDNFIKMIGG